MAIPCQGERVVLAPAEQVDRVLWGTKAAGKKFVERVIQVNSKGAQSTSVHPILYPVMVCPVSLCHTHRKVKECRHSIHSAADQALCP